MVTAYSFQNVTEEGAKTSFLCCILKRDQEESVSILESGSYSASWFAVIRWGSRTAGRWKVVAPNLGTKTVGACSPAAGINGEVPRPPSHHCALFRLFLSCYMGVHLRVDLSHLVYICATSISVSKGLYRRRFLFGFRFFPKVCSTAF